MCCVGGSGVEGSCDYANIEQMTWASDRASEQARSRTRKEQAYQNREEGSRPFKEGGTRLGSKILRKRRSIQESYEVPS